MIKYLNFNKNYNLFILAFCLFGMFVYFGCGKDDKDVTQTVLPKSVTLGIGFEDSTYMNAKPTITSVIPSALKNVITWSAPSFATGLTGYKIYSSGPKEQVVYTVTNGKASLDDTANVTSGFFTFRVSSVFTVYDTVYNYTTEVESLLSDPLSIDR